MFFRLGIEGLGFGILGFGVRVWSLRFGVRDLGLIGLLYGFPGLYRVSIRVYGLERKLCIGAVSGVLGLL